MLIVGHHSILVSFVIAIGEERHTCSNVSQFLQICSPLIKMLWVDLQRVFFRQIWNWVTRSTAEELKWVCLLKHRPEDSAIFLSFAVRYCGKDRIASLRKSLPSPQPSPAQVASWLDLLLESNSLGPTHFQWNRKYPEPADKKVVLRHSGYFSWRIIFVFLLFSGICGKLALHCSTSGRVESNYHIWVW